MYGRQNSDPRPSLYPPIYGEALPPPQTMVPDPYDPYRIFPAPVADEPFAYGRHPSSGTRHPHSTVPPGLDEPGYGVPYPPPHSEYEWHSPHHHGHHESFNAQDEYPPAPAYGHFSSQRVDHPYERDSHEESHAHERHHSHDRSHDSPDHSHHHPSHFRPTSPHSAHYREEEFGPEFSKHSRPSVNGPVVKVFCKANTDYSLALRHDGVVLIPADKDDESQQWILDQSWGSRVRDGTGQPAFALINKASNRALKHAKEAAQQVLSTDFHPGTIEESILWTQSEDMGEGFRTIRMANNINLNLDAFKGDKKCGGVRDGTPAILFKWKKQENQLWKIIPICEWLNLLNPSFKLFVLFIYVQRMYVKNERTLSFSQYR